LITYKAPSGKVYEKKRCEVCGEMELVCPVCGGCSWCSTPCEYCLEDFLEYLREYYRVYKCIDDDYIELKLKEWREK
jgi:hypothetical protein